MTCVVGIVDDGCVVIGGDSAAITGCDMSLRADRKVFRNKDFLLGFTSSFRMGQLLQHSFYPPRRHPDDDVFAYMATQFVDGVRDCLKTGGFARRDNEEEQGGTFLVGYCGRLFTVYADYQIGENLDGYAACGCGGMVAMGSLYSTRGHSAHDRARIALEASERFCNGVRGPFHIQTLVTI